MNRTKYFILVINLLLFTNISYSQITILNFQAPSSISESDGYIEVKADNIELGPYTVSMNGGSTISFSSNYLFSGLSEGLYTFSIADQFGCESTLSHDLKIDCNALDIIFYDIIRPSECDAGSCQGPYGNCDFGSFKVMILGAENYSIYLDELIMNQTLEFVDLEAGKYTVRLRNNDNDCEIEEEIELTPCSVSGINCLQNPSQIPVFNDGIPINENETALISLQVYDAINVTDEFDCNGRITYSTPSNFGNNISVSINIKHAPNEIFFPNDPLCPGLYEVHISNGCTSEVREVQIFCETKNDMEIIATNDCDFPKELTINDANFESVLWYTNPNIYDDNFTPKISQVISQTSIAYWGGKSPVHAFVRLADTGCPVMLSYNGGGNANYVFIDEKTDLCPGETTGSVRLKFYSPLQIDPELIFESGPNEGVANITTNVIEIENLEFGNYNYTINLGTCSFPIDFNIEVAERELEFHEYDSDEELCEYRFVCNGSPIPGETFGPPTPVVTFEDVDLTSFGLDDLFAEFIGIPASAADFVGAGFFANWLNSLASGNCEVLVSCHDSNENYYEEYDAKTLRVHEYLFLLQIARTRSNIPIGVLNAYTRRVGRADPCDRVRFCELTLAPLSTPEGQSGALGIVLDNHNPCNVACGSILPSNNANCELAEELINEYFPEFEIPCMNITTLSFLEILTGPAIDAFQSDPNFSDSDLEKYLFEISPLIENNPILLCRDVTFCTENYGEFNFPSVEDLVNENCENESVRLKHCSNSTPRCDLIQDPLYSCIKWVLCDPTVPVVTESDICVYNYQTKKSINICGNNKVSNSNTENTSEYKIISVHDYNESFIDINYVLSQNYLIPYGKIKIRNEYFNLENNHISDPLLIEQLGDIKKYVINEDIKGLVISKYVNSNSLDLLFSKDQIQNIKTVSANSFSDQFQLFSYENRIYLTGSASGNIGIGDVDYSTTSSEFIYLIQFDYEGNVSEFSFVDTNGDIVGLNSTGSSIGFYTTNNTTIDLFNHDSGITITQQIIIDEPSHLQNFELTETGWLLGVGPNTTLDLANIQISTSNEQKIVHVGFDGNLLWTRDYSPNFDKLILEYEESSNSVYISQVQKGLTSNILIEKVNRNFGTIISTKEINDIEAEVSLKNVYASNNGNLYIGGDFMTSSEFIHFDQESFINPNSVNRSIAFITYTSL